MQDPWRPLRRLHPGAPFLVRFVVLAVLFYAFAWTDLYTQHILPALSAAQAVASGAVLTLFGSAVSVVGNEVRGLTFALRIQQGCDASEATALLTAACLAFEAPWRQRLIAAAAGVVLVFVLNIVRVVTLYWIGLYAGDWFHTAHVDVWPALILLDAMILWTLWARWVRRLPSRDATASGAA